MRAAWLRGIAANPSTPTGILLRLLHDDTREAWKTLCRERDLPQPLIEAILAHPDPVVANLFSHNDKVDSAQLARLLDGPHPDMHERLLNTRPQGRPLPDEIIARLLDTDRPSHLMTREELYSELVFSQSWQAMLVAATHTDPQARARSCGSWRGLTESLRQRLLDDPDELVRQAAADAIVREERVYEPADLPDRPCHALWMILHNFSLSRTLVEHVLGRGQTDEISCIAGNASTPTDVVERLMAHPDSYVRERLATRTDLTGEQLQALINDPDRTVRTAASVNPDLDEVLLADCDIEVSDGNDVRWQPQFWRADPESSIRKAASPNPLVRRQAAPEHRLPVDIARRLAYDDDLGVRVLVCLHHPAAPADALLRCFLEYTGKDRTRLTAHANFPTTGLARFSGHADPQVRCLATRDVSANPEIIERLTHDPDPAVRRAAAGNPRLPAHRIHQLTNDPELARHAAANPALPTDLMRQLLRGAGVGDIPEG